MSPAKKDRPELRETILTLRAQGTPVCRISRLLKLSRNTVRRILRAPPPAEAPEPNAAPCAPETLVWIEDAFRRAGGNGVRVAELLATEHQLEVPYSTF